MRAVAVTAVVVLAGLIGFAAGFAWNVRTTLTDRGYTRKLARVYERAINLLNRMTRVTCLDGDFSADVLSEATRKEITEILEQYRAGMKKASA